MADHLTGWQRDEVASLINATHSAAFANDEPHTHTPILTRCETCAGLYDKIKDILLSS